MSHFCPECGVKKTKVKDRFCANCGHAFVAPETTKTNSKEAKPRAKKPVDKEKIEKKTASWVYWLLGIVGVFGAIIFYHYITYPKSEAELKPLLCDKYWKATSIEVKEIYINGELLPRRQDGIIKAALAANDERAQAYDQMEEMVKKRLQYDDFFILHYNALQKKFFQFDLSFNEEKSNYGYTNENPLLKKTESGFLLEYPEGFPLEYSLETDENDADLFPVDNLTKHTLEIKSISKDALSLIEDFTVVNGDTKEEIRLVIHKDYGLTQPKAKYLEKVNFQKLFFWDAPKPDFKDGF